MGAMHDAPDGSALCTPTLQFDSADFDSPAEAFDRWRDMLAPVYDVSRPSAAELIRFHAQLTAVHLGPAMITQAIAAAQHCQRTSTTMARSQVDHFMAHTCLEGGYHGVVDGSAFQVLPGDVGIFDLSRTWHATCKPFRHLSLMLPRAMIEPLLSRPDRAHGTVLSSATPGGRLLCEHLQSLWRNVPRMTQEDAQRVLRGSASLIAGCLGPTQGAHESPVRAASFSRIRRYVDTNLTRPDLSAEEVCDRFGLSRSTLFRLFAPFGGFAHYLRDQRLRGCFRDIVSPTQAHRRISDIAEHWCFNNEAVFSRAFRRLFDASPRDVRQAALAWATLPEHYAPRPVPFPPMAGVNTTARMS